MMQSRTEYSMKITNILLQNLGPYVGENVLSFDTSDNTRNVILIGGKNGAGKTTLFNSIKIGLYGCRSYGFESENAKYLEIISNLINSKAKLERNGIARVVITVLMEDGKDDFIYRFDRSWKLSTKQLRENLKIYRNDILLDETEKSDFESYLLQLIPPDLFRFYFFDGESISGFVFNGIKNSDFRNAFLKLCGLDTMDIIHDNLLRLSNTRKKDLTGAFETYRAVVSEHDAIQQELLDAEEEKKRISEKIISIDETLAQNENRYLLRGGISKKEYNSMQSQLSREEARRETSRKWLRDAANDIIPFVILRRHLIQLRAQIIAEEQQQTAHAFITELNTPSTHRKLLELFSEFGVNDPMFLSERVIDSLSDSVKTENISPILNLSKREYLDLSAKISSLLAFDSSKISAQVKSINDSLKTTKRIRKKLDKSDASGADSFFAEKDRLLSLKQDQLQLLLTAERKVSELTAACTEAASKEKAAQKKYEEFLKARSVSDTTAKAILAFTDLQKRLYRKYISDVECAFSKSFHALINKSDLIDGIHIDEQLQVFPYKRRTFSRSELKEMLHKMGPAYFVSQLGNIAYDAYLADQDGISDEVTIPVEVKQQLSAGEKQVFIMALYQALSRLNKVSVPYLIDTPFARIDNEHRQNILNNFFMQLRGQIIILSTDEEIVGSYKESIDNAISNYYLLQHAENNGTVIAGDSYFGGAVNA